MGRRGPRGFCCPQRVRRGTRAFGGTRRCHGRAARTQEFSPRGPTLPPILPVKIQGLRDDRSEAFDPKRRIAADPRVGPTTLRQFLRAGRGSAAKMRRIPKSRPGRDAGGEPWAALADSRVLDCRGGWSVAGSGFAGSGFAGSGGARGRMAGLGRRGRMPVVFPPTSSKQHQHRSRGSQPGRSRAGARAGGQMARRPAPSG